MRFLFFIPISRHRTIRQRLTGYDFPFVPFLYSFRYFGNFYHIYRRNFGNYFSSKTIAKNFHLW